MSDPTSHKVPVDVLAADDATRTDRGGAAPTLQGRTG
jgi:hypothetical protein